jgi:hypothetical protein
LGQLDSKGAGVRAPQLSGLGTDEARAVLRAWELAGDEPAWHGLVSRYAGNPLALKLVGETIAELFGGSIAAFLAEGDAVFGDIRLLLDRQVARLSPIEQSLLLWLAIAREPVGVAELAANLARPVARGVVQEALVALRQRSLVERGEQGATVSLQPVVLEYLTNPLVESVVEENVRGQPSLLVSHALLKATAKDYVRQSQEQLLAAPVLEHLRVMHENALELEQQLLDLLDAWRGRPTDEHGYGPGNIANLLRLLRGDLRGVNLSHLLLRQAYLQEVEMHDAQLAGSRLARSVLAEAFYNVFSVALSADGAFLAAGTAEGAVRLWRVWDHRLVLAARGHAGPVFGMAHAMDTRLVVSGGYDGLVKVWDATRGLLLATLGDTQARCLVRQ